MDTMSARALVVNGRQMNTILMLTLADVVVLRLLESRSPTLLKNANLSLIQEISSISSQTIYQLIIVLYEFQ